MFLERCAVLAPGGIAPLGQLIAKTTLPGQLANLRGICSVVDIPVVSSECKPSQDTRRDCSIQAGNNIIDSLSVDNSVNKQSRDHASLQVTSFPSNQQQSAGILCQASGPCSTSYQAGCRQVLGHSSTSWGFAASMQQVRHYKSIKKSMKPLNTLVSRLAVQKVLESPTEEEVVQRSKFRKAPVIDSVLPSLPEVPKPPQYRRVGQIVDEYSLELEPAFAVVEIAGTQFKVTTDDVVFVNHLADVAVNEVLSLDRVMLLGSREGTVIGRPYVPNASVLVAVEEHFKDGKVHVFKFKKRNRYKKYSAPRPVLTALRILRVQGLEGLQADQVGKVQELPIKFFEPVEEGESKEEGAPLQA